MLGQRVDFRVAMTIKELKEVLKDWPDELVDGSDAEVWMETGPGVSSPVLSVCPLNCRQDESGFWRADLLVESG